MKKQLSKKYFTHKPCSLLFLLLSSYFIQAQGTFGKISGTVTTQDGLPAQYSTVSLNGYKGIVIGESGEYAFTNLDAGEYTLTVRFIGMQEQKKEITLESGASLTLDFVLKEDAQALNEVLIVGRKYRITSNKESRYVARMPLKNLENPQVYSVVDKELIKEQMALTLEESFRNVPGAAPAKTGSGMPSFFSRGFQTSENFRNGMATYLRTGIDLASIERVETIKGPTSTLFGAQMTSFGGIVNYITKKPHDTFGVEVSYTTGSWDLSRITADVNLPLKPEEGLLFRLNMARQKENTFQDQGHNATFLIAPSLSYQVNDRLKLSLDADFLFVNGITPAGWYNASDLQATSFDQLNLDYEQSLNDNSLTSKQQSNNILVEAQYKLSDHWTSETRYAWGGGAYDDLYIFDFIWQDPSTVKRVLRTFTNEKTARQNFQQNFTGDFHIGVMRNRLLIGFDYLSSYRKTRYDGLGYGEEVFEPVDLNDLSSAPVVRIEHVQDLLAERNNGQNMTEQTTYSAYVSDVLNLTDQLSVMGSLRIDRFINDGTTNSLTRTTNGAYKQTALSPKFGATYQLIKDKVSLFGNYLNGFKNVGNQIQPDGEVSVFDPQQANQWEAGFKMDLHDAFNATLSYYDINVSNITRSEVRDSLNYIVQDGTQVSRGVELEFIGRPFTGFNYVASYGYNDNEYTKANANIEGNRAIGTPEHVVNLWASYALVNGKAKGLGFGIGNSYVSDSYIDSANSFTLDAYNLLDATLFYNKPQYRISLKFNNILDEEYWVSDGYYARPQKPFNFMARITYKF